jgi:hypothetical protein
MLTINPEAQPVHPASYIQTTVSSTKNAAGKVIRTSNLLKKPSSARNADYATQVDTRPKQSFTIADFNMYSTA